jgi:ankyrin repeat protein
MHIACQFGHKDVADLLADGGADVNALTEVSRKSALMLK